MIRDLIVDWLSTSVIDETALEYFLDLLQSLLGIHKSMYTFEMTVDEAERSVFIVEPNQGCSFIAHLPWETKLNLGSGNICQSMIDAFLCYENDVTADQIFWDHENVFLSSYFS